MLSDPSGYDAYFFYGLPHGENGGFKDRAKAEAEEWEERYGTPVHLIPIKTEEDFINEWSDMGSGDVEIEHVSLYFHSNPYNLIIDYTTEDGEYITAYESGKTQGTKGSNATWIGSLGNKEITGSLVLYACNSGHLDHTSGNLAVTFLKYNNVSNVYAWDGSMKWSRLSGMPTLATNQHYYLSWLNDNNVGFGGFTNSNTRKPRGLIKYHKDNDGKITNTRVKPKGIFLQSWDYVK